MNTIPHLSAIAIVSLIMGFLYVIVQQSYRSGANDPQVQILHDLCNDLEKGKALAFDDSIELKTSLSIFREAYDKNGDPLQSTGYLNGKVARIPKGVFENVRASGEHWITWQPQSHVRMATGIIQVNAAPIAFLAVGRSLREVEIRVSRLTKMIFIGWVLCVCVVLINWLITFYYNHRNYSTHVTK